MSALSTQAIWYSVRNELDCFRNRLYIYRCNISLHDHRHSTRQIDLMLYLHISVTCFFLDCLVLKPQIYSPQTTLSENMPQRTEFSWGLDVLLLVSARIHHWLWCWTLYFGCGYGVYCVMDISIQKTSANVVWIDQAIHKMYMVYG